MMSGRDLRNFVVNHRADSADKLVKRVKNGLGSQKYKAVNYDELKALTLEKRIQGQEKLVKVKKLKEVSKQGKDQNLIKQHRMVWKKELLRLEANRKKLEAEMAMLFHENSGNEHTDQMFLEFEEFEYGLESDFKNFKSNTTDPVWTLREDLDFLVHQYKQGVQKGAEGEDPKAIVGTIDSVKAQQKEIMDKLQREQEALEGELQMGELGNYSLPNHERRIQTGIPAEAFDLECPDEEVKCSLLQEFILIDEKYIERLEQLAYNHEAAISLENGGWSDVDHFAFLYCMEQYTHDVKNRRALYIDRMRRHMPKRTRADIVEHEEWWINDKYYHERRRDLINDWLRDRRELLNRSKVVFAEITAATETKLAEEEFRRHQKGVCSQLYEKVKSWRERKMEAMELQQAVMERERQEKIRIMNIEEEREKKRRHGEKEQLKQYHEKLEQKEREETEQENRRLQELKQILAEQAEHDLERVKFRDDQQSAKVEKRADIKREEEEKIKERERILEAIRMQVRPHVEGDLLRLWSDTEAVKQRLKPDEEYIQIHQPLYQVNSYTSKQITEDPRHKLEHRLREAGLHEHDYARKLISQTQPAKEPRRDMFSTVFKHETG